MLRFGALLALLAVLAAGCSIDRVEWESTGYVVEAATQKLEREYGLEKPFVECIHYDAGAAFWKCRAHAGTAAFKCKVVTGPREVIHEIECEREEPQQDEPAAAG
jgi:hypothetical protein